MRPRDVMAVMCAGALLAAVPAEARPAPPKISVLSNRADLVSGGDALVRVTLPRGVRPSRLRLSAGHRNVTRALRRTGRRRLDGRVRGLKVGRMALTARIRGGSASRLYVRNHRIGGPVFAGPQVQPWACQPGAKDAKCNQKPTYRFFYLPKGSSRNGAALPGTNSNDNSGSFRPYDPKNPPPRDQIDTATTPEGVTVPFIVRLESGYIDRDQYAIATLYQPGKRWRANRPQRQFNHRL